MTNEEQKLREIAYKHAEPKVIWNDGNMSIYPDEEKIESLLSDLTAFISDGYVSKEAYNVIKEHYQSALAANDVEKDYIDKYYYPKEFVRWMFQGCPFIIGENGAGNIIAFSVRDGKQFTFDELFNYWRKGEQ